MPGTVLGPGKEKLDKINYVLSRVPVCLLRSQPWKQKIMWLILYSRIIILL